MLETSANSNITFSCPQSFMRFSKFFCQLHHYTFIIYSEAVKSCSWISVVAGSQQLHQETCHSVACETTSASTGGRYRVHGWQCTCSSSCIARLRHCVESMNAGFSAQLVKRSIGSPEWSGDEEELLSTIDIRQELDATMILQDKETPSKNDTRDTCQERTTLASSATMTILH